MKKSTTLALAGLMAVSAAANATMSRWNGFGAASAFIAGVADIWSLPGAVTGYKNATYFEFGNAPALGAAGQAATGGWGGVHAEVGPGVLGIWINRGTNGTIVNGGSAIGGLAPAGGLANFTLGTSGAILPGLVGGIAGADETNIGANVAALGGPSTGRVDILYGFDLNDKVALGISVSRGNSNIKQEVAAPTSTTISYDANALGLGLGAEIKEVAFVKLLEIGLIFESESMLLSGKSTAGEDKLSAAATGFGLRIGGDIAGDNGKFSRAEINFNTTSGEAKNEAANGAAGAGFNSNKGGFMNWNLGYAMGGSKDKGMGLMGLRLLGSSASNESDAPNSKTDSGALALELSVAGEGKVKDWLTARAGMSGNLWQSQGNKNSASPSTTNSSSNNGAAVITTGLTATFGDIAIDGVLNKDVLYTGGFLLSGLAENIFTQLSATWSW